MWNPYGDAKQDCTDSEAVTHTFPSGPSSSFVSRNSETKTTTRTLSLMRQDQFRQRPVRLENWTLLMSQMLMLQKKRAIDKTFELIRSLRINTKWIETAQVSLENDGTIGSADGRVDSDCGHTINEVISHNNHEPIQKDEGNNQLPEKKTQNSQSTELLTLSSSLMGNFEGRLQEERSGFKKEVKKAGRTEESTECNGRGKARLDQPDLREPIQPCIMETSDLV
ncbi:hypothetical protein CAEBREN_07312 [Caenorhabditis brenneri]|uniref:Uncharacterized protein n=1 Tax=Caenorhabditis brenneri TaxID=135651 RepID=G0P7T4_CAEBE|nr:hypothetical protein CAEBREN_07312 [Caenorhabditis brenneri]